MLTLEEPTEGFAQDSVDQEDVVSGYPEGSLEAYLNSDSGLPLELQLSTEQKTKLFFDSVALTGNPPGGKQLAATVTSSEEATSIKETAKAQHHKSGVEAYAEGILFAEDMGPAEKATKLQEKQAAAPELSTPTERALTSLEDWSDHHIKQTAQAIDQELNISRMIEDSIAKDWKDRSAMDATLDFLGAVVPLAWNINILSAARVVDDKAALASGLGNIPGAVAIGEVKKQMVEKFRDASYEEQQQILRDIDVWAETNSGLVSDKNIFMAMEVKSALLDYGNGERTLDNVLGVLEVSTLGIGKFIRKLFTKRVPTAAAIHTIGKPVNTPLILLNSRRGKHADVAKDKAGSVAEKMENGEDASVEVLQALNIRHIDNAIDDVSAMGSRPALLTMLKDIAQRQASLLTEKLNSARILSDLEKQTVQAEVERQAASRLPVHVHEFKHTSPKAHTKDGETVFGDEQGFTFDVIYGKEAGGYEEYWQAQKAAKTLPESIKEGSEIVIHDAATNTYHPIGTSLSELAQPSFYVKTKQKHVYDVEKDIIKDQLGTNGMFRDNVWIRGVGYLTSYMKDNGNRLRPSIMNMLNVASDTRFTLRNNLREHIKVLNDLKPASQGRVFELLEEGSKQEKVFTVPEMLVYDPKITDVEMAAYLSTRSLLDVTDTMKNSLHRTALEKEGYKHYLHGTLTTIARPLEHKPGLADVHKVWDGETNTIRTVTQKELDELYSTGGHVARLNKSEIVGETMVDHLWVKTSKMQHELPMRVLNHRPGYIKRFYKEKWFVDVVRNVTHKGNPRAVKQTIAAYGTKDEALAHSFSPELRAELKSGKVTIGEPRLDEKLQLTVNGELDALRTEGKLFTSKRGEHLAGSAEGDLARVEDVMTSIERDINNVSTLVAHGDVATNIKARMHAHYGAKHFDPITGKITADASKEAHEAQGVLDWFNGVPNLSDKVARAGLVRFSTWLEGKGYKKAAGVVFGRSGFSPTQNVRSTTYGTFIAMNPGKQLLLQGSQFLLLAGAHPIKAVQAMRQVSSFHTAYLLRNSDKIKRIEPALAKAAGVSLEEFRAMTTALRDTGLLQSLSNHSVIQSTDVFHAKTGSVKGMSLVAQRAGNAIKMPFNVVQKAGFQAGEAHNLTMSWLMAHNLWKDANKGKKWIGDRSLYGDWGATARQWALNANTMGSFKFQKGILATTTQFWAFQVKAWEAILVSGGVFSKQERAGMFAGMLAMWGTTGVFAEGMWDKYEAATGNKTPEWAREYIENGLLDHLLNDLGTAVGGDDMDGNGSAIAFSNAMSPLGGIGLLVDFATRDDVNVFEAMGGVSSYAYSTYKNTLTFASAVWKDEEMETVDQALTFVARLTTAFPLVGNAERGLMAYNLMRSINKSTLTDGEKVTASEALMLGVAGFMSRKQLMEYENKEISREYLDDAKDAGKAMAHHFNSKFKAVFDEFGLIPPEKWYEVQQYLSTIQRYASPEAKKAMKSGFDRYFIGNPAARSDANQFLTEVGSIVSDVEVGVRRINKDPRLTPEMREILIPIYRQMMENSALAAEVNE